MRSMVTVLRGLEAMPHSSQLTLYPHLGVRYF